MIITTKNDPFSQVPPTGRPGIIYGVLPIDIVRIVAEYDEDYEEDFLIRKACTIRGLFSDHSEMVQEIDELRGTKPERWEIQSKVSQLIKVYRIIDSIRENLKKEMRLFKIAVEKYISDGGSETIHRANTSTLVRLYSRRVGGGLE